VAVLVVGINWVALERQVVLVVLAAVAVAGQLMELADPHQRHHLVKDLPEEMVKPLEAQVLVVVAVEPLLLVLMLHLEAQETLMVVMVA
jgi:hypothetical protein